VIVIFPLAGILFLLGLFLTVLGFHETLVRRGICHPRSRRGGRGRLLDWGG
jgi:hypothetical protein